MRYGIQHTTYHVVYKTARVGARLRTRVRVWVGNLRRVASDEALRAFLLGLEVLVDVDVAAAVSLAHRVF